MRKFQNYLHWSVALLLLMPVTNLYAQQYGNVDFETSCNTEARESFHTGLALMHHMMYVQAGEKFKQAAEVDPQCAMAHWGIAMSYIHPLWGERPSDEYLMKGSEALGKAQSLTSHTTRESAYIKVVGKFYEDWKNTPYDQQLAALEKGFALLSDQYPNDVDAAALYALSHLATAPKSDKNYTHQKKAGALLEKLHKQYPRHPGLFHYIIHAYDNPVLAERAVEVARAYDKIAPNVPHALHMPSHIFVRQGIWGDVIEWNKRSAEAALGHSVNGNISMHYPHAVDYLIYAHLQRGEDQKAEEALNKLNNKDNYQTSLASAYAIAASQARYPLERHKWSEAKQLPVRSHQSIAWDKSPAAESISWFARGIGAARSGDLASARESITKLEQIESKLRENGDTYWTSLTKAQRLSVDAWTTYAEDNHQKALVLMKEAADLEDSLDKHPVTPGHVLPARELLGDMHLEANEPERALKAYNACLEINTNRFNCLYGAGYAAEQLENHETARQYYSRLIDIAGSESVERPKLSKAKKFITATK